MVNILVTLYQPWSTMVNHGQPWSTFWYIVPAMVDHVWYYGPTMVNLKIDVIFIVSQNIVNSQQRKLSVNDKIKELGTRN